jgi:TrmH family RNA methyltransferase
MKLTAFRIVLCRPMYAGNVGASARVAANFGIDNIVVVAPECDWRGSESRMYAKGPAQELLERAREVSTLAEAVRDCGAAVGFTRRTGTLRRPQITLSEIADFPEHGTTKVALVFGREDKGLGREELSLCTHVATFKVTAEMPSLNLSHAVAVAASRIFEERKGAAPESASKRQLAHVAELEELFGHWREAMIDAGMTTAGNPERMLAHIRRALQRAELTARDVAIFRGYLSKTQVAMGTRSRGRQISRRNKE